MPPQATKYKPFNTWTREQKDKHNQRVYEWRQKNRDKYLAQKKRNVFRKYGLTKEEFDALAATQGYACAICRKVPKARLHIDHNHETGRVRGLLCSNCNTAIGLLKDRAEFLLNAVNYLLKK